MKKRGDVTWTLFFLALATAFGIYKERQVRWLRSELTASKFDCAVMDYQSAKEMDQIQNAQNTEALTYFAFQNREGEIIPDQVIFGQKGMVLPQGISLRLEKGYFDSESKKIWFEDWSYVNPGERYRIVIKRETSYVQLSR